MTNQARSFRRTVVKDTQGRYLIRFPKGYRDQLEASWPLLLFLHGAGERGRDLSAVRRHGPLADTSPDDLPCIVVAPQCGQDDWWNPTELTALLEVCLERYRVDMQRVYGTGISMGATGLWTWTSRIPHLIAAIAPICGRADPLWASGLVDVPAWAIHGAGDSVIPSEQSRTIVHAIQQAGGAARLTIVSDADHDVWTPFYSDPSFYAWLFAHENRISV